MICSAIIEHVEKHDERHDSALLTLLDWFHQLVAPAASGCSPACTRTLRNALKGLQGSINSDDDDVEGETEYIENTSQLCSVTLESIFAASNPPSAVLANRVRERMPIALSTLSLKGRFTYMC